jgi:Putative motility protein
MDVSQIASLSTALSQSDTNNSISVAVLKKAMNLQAQSAAQLIQALPTPPSSKLPHLGNHLNTVA